MEFTKEYLDDLLVRMAHHSTAIEGNTLTQAETASILIYNKVPRSMDLRELYEVKNYAKSLNLLFDTNKQKITPNLIKEFHKEIMNELVDNNGEFKKIQNLITTADFEPTKPYLVPTELKNWCDNYNYRLENSTSKEEKIKTIADMHIKFERIHPFSDGNGRTGRFIIVHSCLSNDLSPIIIPKEEKGTYIKYLADCDNKGLGEWFVELEKKERERINLFINKERHNKDANIFKIEEIENINKEKEFLDNAFAKLKPDLKSIKPNENAKNSVKEFVNGLKGQGKDKDFER